MQRLSSHSRQKIKAHRYTQMELAEGSSGSSMDAQRTITTSAARRVHLSLGKILEFVVGYIEPVNGVHFGAPLAPTILVLSRLARGKVGVKVLTLLFTHSC